MLNELREKFIGMIADTDNLSEEDYSVIDGGIRIAWECERDECPLFYAFEVQFDDNEITAISVLTVEKMTGEDAASSTWEAADPDDDDYAEMEEKLSELCASWEDEEDEE